MTCMTLLFEGDSPCWDEETIQLAGENPEKLADLQDRGFLLQSGSGFVLSEAGIKERNRLAEEMGIPVAPSVDLDPEEALWNNRLYLLMDRAFVGRWGLKEFRRGEKLPVIPYLTGDDLYRIGTDGIVSYTWKDHPFISSYLESFPRWGVAARPFSAPGESKLLEWRDAINAPSGEVTIDLLLRSSYDFKYYRKINTLTTDKFRFQNVDRLFCLRVRDPEDLDDVLIKLGLIHIFMLGQKRVYIPGWSDIDGADQENWTMVLLVTDAEEEISRVIKRLSPSGKNLIAPCNPLFLLGTSIEALRKNNGPREMIYDWFCYDVHHIARPDIS